MNSITNEKLDVLISAAIFMINDYISKHNRTHKSNQYNFDYREYQNYEKAIENISLNNRKCLEEELNRTKLDYFKKLIRSYPNIDGLNLFLYPLYKELPPYGSKII